MLNAVYHGDGKSESGVKGSGGEEVCHVDVGSKITKVAGDNNATVAVGPNVVFELLARVWGGREDHAFVRGDSGSEVVQVGVGEGDFLDEVLNVMGPGSGIEEIVRKRSGTAFASRGDNVPSVNKKCNPHHAERASLGDTAAAFMGLPKAGGKSVVYEEFLLKTGVSVDEKGREAGGGGKPVEKRPVNLVETFPNIRGGAAVRSIVKSVTLHLQCSFVPSVLGAKSAETGKHAINLPLASPWLEVVEA